MGVVCRVVGGVIFQSTPPARGATPAKHAGIRARRNFNPRPPARGATLMVSVDTPTAYISIHAPREGGDRIPCFLLSIVHLFQSTPPARGAT